MPILAKPPEPLARFRSRPNGAEQIRTLPNAAVLPEPIFLSLARLKHPEPDRKNLKEPESVCAPKPRKTLEIVPSNPREKKFTRNLKQAPNEPPSRVVAPDALPCKASGDAESLWAYVLGAMFATCYRSAVAIV